MIIIIKRKIHGYSFSILIRFFSNFKEATNLAAVKFTKTETLHGPQKGIRACVLVYGPAGDMNLKIFPAVMTHAHL